MWSQAERLTFRVRQDESGTSHVHGNEWARMLLNSNSILAHVSDHMTSLGVARYRGTSLIRNCFLLGS